MALASWNSSDNTAPFEEMQLPEELSPKDNGISIVLSNLGFLLKEDGILHRRQTAQIRELVSLLSDSGETLTRESLSELIEERLLPILRSTTDRSEGHGSWETTLILLCKELLRQIPKSPFGSADEIFGHSDSIPAKASEKVAYLQNRFTDTAFMKLTAHLSRPRAAYFGSFADACEEVYHGLCEYCILPVESSSDGKLLRFYALIEKYELKIVAVYDAETSDGSYTRYALLRHKAIPLSSQRKLNGERFAEFSLILNGHCTLSEILYAAALCGMHPLRIDSFPLAYKDGEYRYDLVFSLPECIEEKDHGIGADTEAFLLYLALSLSEYTPLGVYTKTF